MFPDVTPLPVEPPVELPSDEPELDVFESETALAFNATVLVSEPDVSFNVPLNVPVAVLLKFIWSCAPVAEFTLAADNVDAPEEKPVPVTVTVVAPVRLVPVTTTVDVCVLFTVTFPKSTVEPLAGDVYVADVVVPPEDEPLTVAFRVTLTVVLPLVRVRVPVYVPPYAPLKLT